MAHLSDCISNIMASSTNTGGVATSGNGAVAAFDPTHVDLTSTANPNLARDVVCYLDLSQNDYNGQLGKLGSPGKLCAFKLTVAGARISALFVILIVSSAATFFPVLAARVRWMRIPVYVYLFARYFGAGVIVATAFIQ